MADSKVFMFPENGNGGNSSIDPALLVAMNQNGGFGNGAMWMWPMFMWMMFPWLYGANGGGFGGWGANGAAGAALGAGYLSNQINENQSTDTLLQAINGRADAASQLAQLTHANVNQVESAISNIQSAIATLSGTVGLTGQQIISQILSGDAALSQQLCKCCCDNQLAIANQTAALQAGTTAAQNSLNQAITAGQFANQAGQAQIRQDIAMAKASEELGVCQQTNQLGSQADRNTQTIKDAIAAQSAMITSEFCALKERELQSKIDTQGEIITQLRGQIDNAAQTAQFYNMLTPIKEQVATIAAKQPNTVPVQYPNLTAVNNTPYSFGYPYPYGYGYGNGGFFG